MSKLDIQNVTDIRLQARADWEENFKRRLSLQERIRESIPWWLVIVAGVFFLLSVPHTAAVFDKITPGVGKIAPLGIEFGLLYAAFRRRVGQKTRQLLILEILLFLTAIMANGAGSLEAVVASTQDVQGLSVSDLMTRIGDLPATSQVALLLVPMAAFIIPIGTVVAGEGLAALALEYRETGNLMLEQWEVDAQDVEFVALRDAALNKGHTPKAAIRWASEVVGREVAESVPSGQRTGRKRTVRTVQRMKATPAVLEWLDRGGDPNMPVREMAEVVSREMGVDVSKTTTHAAAQTWKARNNGHEEGVSDE